MQVVHYFFLCFESYFYFHLIYNRVVDSPCLPEADSIFQIGESGVYDADD